MRTKPSVHTALEYDPTRHEQIATAMTAQALLHHTSAQRGAHIVEMDVRNTGTLHALVVDVRMAIYDVRLKEKLSAWAAIASDVTYMQARLMGADELVQLIGSHAHGLSKAQFWAVAKAAREDADRESVFLNKCNQPFQNYWSSDYCKRRTSNKRSTQ